jgi:anhydro-N-acetylmuramic acid kinase
MDGLDIGYCEIIKIEENWSYSLLKTETLKYSNPWKLALSGARTLSTKELEKLNVEYGRFLGESVVKFMGSNGISKVDFISSHGHTVFHQPEVGYTLQIGDGLELRNTSGFPVVCDFRTQDVNFGGQGAPLVPIGDQFLFSDYDACINLGGFANISFELENKRVAFDICPVNVVLNVFSQKLGFEYDNNGQIARSGQLIPEFLHVLNRLSYYSEPIPRSLGMEWVERSIFPLVSDNYSAPDVLHTFSKHIADQISKVVNQYGLKRILVTGGGAYNGFILDQLRKNEGVDFEIPDAQTLEFKEALIFAFLGVLKWRGDINVLQSVTGASQDHSSGVIIP